MTADYCRAIERYLCQKNDGHLIRVVGPAFEIVSRWEREGIPLKVACRGIDRYFERYYRARPRRRPLRVEFCDTDVLEVFEQWRQALGLTRTIDTADRDTRSADPGGATGLASTGDSGDAADDEEQRGRRGPSLRAHLERASVRLSSARATGRIGPSADATLDRLSAELDLARASARGLRGVARAALLDRLIALDRELMDVARGALDAPVRTAIEDEARQELQAFRQRMAADSYDRAWHAAIDRLVRERSGLPVLAFT